MVGYDRNRPKLRTYQYALAGGLSSAVTRACISPLDIVKIRMQLGTESIQDYSVLKERKVQKILQNTSVRRFSTHTIPLQILATRHYPTCFHIIKKIYATEGLRAFWKGHAAAQTMGISYGVLQLPVFEFVTRQTCEYLRVEKTREFQALMCGGVAAGITQFIVQPIDTIRVRMVATGGGGGSGGVYKSFSSAIFHHIGSVDRALCLWKGTKPAIIGIIPYTSLQFMFVTFFQRFTDSSGAAGFCGGLCAKMITYPLDLVKKRLQVQASFNRPKMDGRLNYTGILDCGRDMLRHERGIKNLYRGGSVAVFKSATTACLVWSTYHKFQGLIMSL